ncbi:MAG: acyltransferase [Actinomycetota bacterium]|nr:acyltransferase [Actinomycetota bacterium]
MDRHPGTGLLSPEAGSHDGPPPVVAPPPGHPRFPAADSLRAIAALSVLAAHASFLSSIQHPHWWRVLTEQLTVGVPVFFVLSGFLLYRPFFSSEVGPAPRPRVGDFTRRRLLRIIPAYWLALTLLAIEPGLSDVFTHDWWRYYGFLMVYEPLTRELGLTVAWTLCIEVTFYIALPLYAAVTRRMSRGLAPNGRIRLQLALLTILGLGSVAFGYLRHDPATPSLLTYFDWFALGMGLAVISTAERECRRSLAPIRWLERWPSAGWVLALAGYLAVCGLVAGAAGFQVSSSAFYLLGEWRTLVLHLSEGLIACLIVAPAVLGGHGGWPRRLLAARPLLWLGLVSYGIYLWNLPLGNWLYGKGLHGFVPLLIATVGFATACAAGSYYVFERPILQLKEPRSLRIRLARRVGRRSS